MGVGGSTIDETTVNELITSSTTDFIKSSDKVTSSTQLSDNTKWVTPSYVNSNFLNKSNDKALDASDVSSNNKWASPQFIKNYMMSDVQSNIDFSNYQTKGSYALASDLNNYQTKGNYALASDLTNYQTKGSYALASDLANYALANDLANYQTRGSYALAAHNHDSIYQTKGTYALASDLANYQTRGSYALASDLANYALATNLANYQTRGSYALVSDLANYALATNLANYQTRGSYALASDLVNYQTRGSYALAAHNHDSIYQTRGSYALASDLANYQTRGSYALASDLANYQTRGSYALAAHNHDALYASISHNHDALYQTKGSYAAAVHNHDALYSPINHNHDTLYQTRGSYVLSSAKASSSSLTTDNESWVTPAYVTGRLSIVNLNNTQEATITSNLEGRLVNNSTFQNAVANNTGLLGSSVLQDGIVRSIVNSSGSYATTHNSFFNRVINDNTFRTAAGNAAAANETFRTAVASNLTSVPANLNTIVGQLNSSGTLQTTVSSNLVNNVNFRNVVVNEFLDESGDKLTRKSGFIANLAAPLSTNGSFIGSVASNIIDDPNKRSLLNTRITDSDLKFKLLDENKGVWCADGICRVTNSKNLQISGGDRSDLFTPNGNLKINQHGIQFGGNNKTGYETNSAQISAGIHDADSLNIVGMSNATGSSQTRRVKIWAEGGMDVVGKITTNNSLELGSGWSLVPDGENLFIKKGIYTIARFSTGWDKFLVFPNANPNPPYFFVNNGSNFGIHRG